MTEIRTAEQGLSAAEVKMRQAQYGRNELVPLEKMSFFKKILHIVSEPMFLLLLAAAVIYFILGEPRDGAIMLVFVVAIISIDVVQEWKTDKTLKALKDLSAPHVTVIRGGAETKIASEELVPGDLMILCEGVKIPADGFISKCSDFCVDESSLTGEAEGVWKVPLGEADAAKDYWRKDYCYAGTLVTQGSALVQVEKTGRATEYGKIGTHVAEAPDRPTPLEKQTASLVKTCALIAGALFLMVMLVTYLDISDHPLRERLIESVLSGITLAMAMIPEEFPVILTVFLSMGAWRLAKKQSLVRRLPSVETLGAISVLCVDKTGTITMNQMTLQSLWAYGGDEKELCRVMGMGCELETYDPMEKAMLGYCAKRGLPPEEIFEGVLLKEYAFTNELKMMGHLWEKQGVRTIAAKGSPERILTVCALGGQEKGEILRRVDSMGEEGLRVIAVASQRLNEGEEAPSELQDCRMTFLGLVGLADPPREGVKEDVALCAKAGIRVVMITGDNGATASAIARKVGLPDCDTVVTGDMLNHMSDEELRAKVEHVSIFSRVVPEHKMRIVKAFREAGHIVAMTGDGVNDAPALKYADIGIAMGRRGSEVSREAADLVMMDDNFTTIVETVRDGRRIYDNIRKAVGYVFSIHIPIAAASLLAPLMGIAPADMLLLPLHVVLLELVIDPTCSIVLERQPAEPDIMKRPPRRRGAKLLSAPILVKSVLQGLTMFAATFGSYCAALHMGGTAELARSMGLVILLLANLFLVIVNSSECLSAAAALRLLAKDWVMWAVSVGSFLGVLVILYSPLCAFLKLAPLSAAQFLEALALAAASVFWYEIVKAWRNWRGERG